MGVLQLQSLSLLTLEQITVYAGNHKRVVLLHINILDDGLVVVDRVFVVDRDVGDEILPAYSSLFLIAMTYRLSNSNLLFRTIYYMGITHRPASVEMLIIFLDIPVDAGVHIDDTSQLLRILVDTDDVAVHKNPCFVVEFLDCVDTQNLDSEFVQVSVNAPRIARDCNGRHDRDVFHESHAAAFGGLRRTNDTPLCVVQFSRLNKLS